MTYRLTQTFSLSSAGLSGPGTEPFFVETSDFDRDGNPEIIVPTLLEEPGGTPVSVFELQSDGSFVDIASDLFGGPVMSFGVLDILAEDVNGDGWQDLILADAGNTSVALPVGARNPVYLSDGLGGWRNVTGTISDITAGVAAGDIDQDGRTEIIFANILGSLPTISEVNLGGVGLTRDDRLVSLFPSLGIQDDYFRVRVVDLDGDGDQDVILGTAGPLGQGTVSGVGRWNGSTFDITTLPSSIQDFELNFELQTIDVNGDGLLDILSGSVGALSTDFRTMSVLVQGQDGSFTDQTSAYFDLADLSSRVVTADGSLFNGAVAKIHVHDLDLDGDLDLVLDSGEGAAARIFLREGGRFELQDMLPGPLNGFDNLALLDQDGDGMLEILSVDVENRQLTVYDRGTGLGDDRFVGSDLGGPIFGLTGADTLFGGFGDDTISGEGTDAEADAIAAQVFRMYGAALGRTPDMVGFDTWTSRLADGQSIEDVAERFVQSREFQTRFDTDSTADFVTLMYGNVLGRGPDPVGFETWTSRIDDDGWSRARVVTAFSESRENIARTEAEALSYSSAGIEASWADDVYRLYQATLGRSPDLNGFFDWVERLANGESYLSVVERFVQSSEFQTRFTAELPGDFVELLYQNILGRSADPTGFATWTGQLSTGEMTRAEVVQALARSAEFEDRTVGEMTVWMSTIGEGDVLDGGAGNNILFGGIGADTFVFDARNGGDHVIADREVWDSLAFNGFGYGTDTTLVLDAMRQDGADLIFEDQGVTVTLLNTLKSDIDPTLIGLDLLT